MGTNTVVSRENLGTLTFHDYTQEDSALEEDSGPLRPEDFID
jgi:hypothetical protein